LHALVPTRGIRDNLKGGGNNIRVREPDPRTLF
jgi:hypothetical protein